MRSDVHSREHDVSFVCNNEDCDNEAKWEIRGIFNTNGTLEVQGDDMGSEADCPECGDPGSPEDTDVIYTVISE